jgi:hypothetical protein
MSHLRGLQQDFIDYLLGEAGVAATQEAVSASEGQFRQQIAHQGGIATDTRLQIYANAYRMRLRETIETDHEILGLFLGDELFDKMAGEYTVRHPSQSSSLRHFCDGLADFLAEDPFFGQYPILADIACFERRLLASFDAADSHRASFAELQALSAELWPGCRLRFHPSVQLFCCDSNAVECWQSLKHDKAPPQPDYEGKRAWLLWRGATRLTEFISLAPYQLCLLEGFIHGANFAQQCEAMLNYVDAEQAPLQVLQSLQAWFSMGLVRCIVREDHKPTCQEPQDSLS